MIITSVQIRDTKTGTRLEGVASVTFDDMMVIHDIKIISNAEGGCFLAMPSRKLPNGTFTDIAHPISREARGALENIIISCFGCMRGSGLPNMNLRLGMNNTKKCMTEQVFEDFEVVQDVKAESYA
ncbi:MAG: SpoVG family protein [Clostridia bacterium]|nr:SpoVG family protein [Clostridia bacterium]